MRDVRTRMSDNSIRGCQHMQVLNLTYYNSLSFALFLIARLLHGKVVYISTHFVH